jgi:hypothetical protein
MRSMTRIVAVGYLAAVLVVPPAWAGGEPGGGEESPPSVLKAATKFVKAVRARSVERILAFADDGGIPCVDSLVSKAEFERQLWTKGTWLNAYFLDPAAFRATFADLLHIVSFAELVTQAGFSMRVYPEQDPRFTCVRFSSSTGASAELCFALKGKRWVLSYLPNCV